QDKAGAAAGLPCKGTIVFDSGDLALLDQHGLLLDTVTHEIGHVLGFGTIWEDKIPDMLQQAGGETVAFLGRTAVAEYQKLPHRKGPVPIERNGGSGTQGRHWDDDKLPREMMSGMVEQSGKLISRVTVASLQDLGWVVDLDNAENYALV